MSFNSKIKHISVIIHQSSTKFQSQATLAQVSRPNFNFSSQIPFNTSDFNQISIFPVKCLPNFNFPVKCLSIQQSSTKFQSQPLFIRVQPNFKVSHYSSEFNQISKSAIIHQSSTKFQFFQSNAFQFNRVQPNFNFPVKCLSIAKSSIAELVGFDCFVAMKMCFYWQFFIMYCHHFFYFWISSSESCFTFLLNLWNFLY
jgi:hypothetical protein